MAYPPDILTALERYCAYRDRSPFEVERKAYSWGIPAKDWPACRQLLEENGFLSAKRFAENFARGKLHQNGWGRLKIRHALLGHQIEKELIESALAALDEQTYLSKLDRLAKNKARSLRHHKDREERLLRFLYQRGFEYELLLSRLKSWF